MATRAEIEAQMAAKLGTAPAKRTRAEIEAEMAAKLGAPAAKKVPSTEEYMASAAGKNEREQMLRGLEKGNSFLDNALIGSGNVVAGMGRGFEQLAARATGDDAKLAGLQAEEADIRQRLEPVTSSAGGITGNILTNAALFAVPGAKAGQAATAGTTALKLSPKVAGLLGAMLAESGTGARRGALTPTVAGESLEGNVGTQAGLGAAGSLLGPLLRSEPVQKAADTILDYTPLVAGARRRARNLAADTAYAAEKATYGAAKTDAAERTRYAQSLRSQEALQEKMLHESEAQSAIAEAAGWSKFPTNKVDMEKELKRIGSEYGELIAPVRMPVPDVADIADQPGSVIGGYVRKLTSAAEKNGAVPGETYKEVRADIVEELQTAQGEARGQLKELLGRLDRGFEASIAPDKLQEVIAKRSQYSLGSTMRNADWTPGKGADVAGLRKRIDRRELSEDLRRRLYAAEEAMGATKGREPVVPFDVGMEAPVKPIKEVSDPFRLGAVNVGLAGGLTALGAPAGVVMPALPLTAAAIKQANNPKVAKMVNALRRGATIGYGTVLAPGEDE